MPATPAGVRTLILALPAWMSMPKEWAETSRSSTGFLQKILEIRRVLLESTTSAMRARRFHGVKRAAVDRQRTQALTGKKEKVRRTQIRCKGKPEGTSPSRRRAAA